VDAHGLVAGGWAAGEVLVEPGNGFGIGDAGGANQRVEVRPWADGHRDVDTSGAQGSVLLKGLLEERVLPAADEQLHEPEDLRLDLRVERLRRVGLVAVVDDLELHLAPAHPAYGVHADAAACTPPAELALVVSPPLVLQAVSTNAAATTSNRFMLTSIP
jgi:hypothetical protein